MGQIQSSVTSGGVCTVLISEGYDKIRIICFSLRTPSDFGVGSFEIRIESHQIQSLFCPAMESAPKRRRIQRSQSPTYELDDQDNSYEPYIPVAQRREAKLAKLASWGASSEKENAKKQLDELEERKDEEEEEAKRKEKARKERTLLMEAQDVHSKKAEEGECSIYLDILKLTLTYRREKN